MISVRGDQAMSDVFFSFRGRVPRGGFRWLMARPADAAPGKGPQPFLVAAHAAGEEPGGRAYHAEGEEPGERAYELSDLDAVAYRSFAETQLDQEAVLAFANKFGALGLAVPITVNPEENARDHEA